MAKTSRIPGFYNLDPSERLKKVAESAGLTEEETGILRRNGNLDLSVANRMIENVIGTMSYPYALAMNFLIDEKEYLVPMVIEEPSVVAAASNAAKMMRNTGGIFTTATDPIMIGQVQIIKVKDPHTALLKILEKKSELIELANAQDPTLVKFGGGAKDIEAKVIDGPLGPMIVVNMLIDVRDAMGGNAVNTMAESVAPLLEKVTGGRVLLRILSNLADRRIVRARATINKDDIGGAGAVEAIVHAWAFASSDPYRAATHNKGIMNGVAAVALATAQDHRALEAGAHAYAARSGRYLPLSTWETDEKGNLVGSLEMPMAVGTVGGATKTHPVARISLKILGVSGASELARIMGAVGLAQNFAALRALSIEGIQKGHLRLHARNIAVMAGATGDLIDKIAERMSEEGKIRFDRAQELVKEMQK